MVRRLKIVGVMGSGLERHEKLSLPLGEMLARLGVNLLTGGGQGVMEAVAEAFVSVQDRKGVAIGVLPGQVDATGCGAPPGYPNRFVEIAIQTHLPGRGADGATPRSRNAINIASAHAVVVLPGGAGTASEALLALKFGKPVIGFGGGGAAEGILQGETLGEVREYLQTMLEL